MKIAAVRITSDDLTDTGLILICDSIVVKDSSILLDFIQNGTNTQARAIWPVRGHSFHHIRNSKNACLDVFDGRRRVHLCFF
jgi:hypothetical protein